MNLDQLTQTAVAYLESDKDSSLPPTQLQIFLEIQSQIGHIVNSLKGLKSNSYGGWIYNLKPEGTAKSAINWELAHLLNTILIDYHYYSKNQIDQEQLDDLVSEYNNGIPSIADAMNNLMTYSAPVKLQALTDLCTILDINLNDVIGTFTMIFDKDYQGE